MQKYYFDKFDNEIHIDECEHFEKHMVLLGTFPNAQNALSGAIIEYGEVSVCPKCCEDKLAGDETIDYHHDRWSDKIGK